MSLSHCFASLCVGETYCQLGRLLVGDVQKQAPEKDILILTSHPRYFKNCSRAVVFKHSQKSPFFIPNDKFYLIKKALSLYDSVTQLDADEKVFKIGPDSFKSFPGITALVHFRLLRHESFVKNKKVFKLTQDLCEKLRIDIEKVQFIHEHLFTVTKDSGRERDFLAHWKLIKSYFEMNGYHGGEGVSMGLAAAKANFPVRRDQFSGFEYYKECIFNVKLQKMQLDEKYIAEMKPFRDLQRSIEYPKRNIFARLIWNRYTRKYSLGTAIRFIKLSIEYFFMSKKAGL